VYVQVSRSGTTFTAATSPDGVNWTPLPNSATSLPNLTGSLLTGVAVTSHNPAQLSTVAFNSVLVG
jgi:hypothetical protein